MQGYGQQQQPLPIAAMGLAPADADAEAAKCEPVVAGPQTAGDKKLANYLLTRVAMIVALAALVIITAVVVPLATMISEDTDAPGEAAASASYATSLSRIRNQAEPAAECWDLLNQRWTQIVSEEDTGGLVTIMKVDLPNGCKQLAHVHCGLHEAFYKLDNNGDAIWSSAADGAWWEVAPIKGDFSYAPMGQGHGYTNGEVSSCNGVANVAGYTATTFTSHLVFKLPGFEHETRARTVPKANPTNTETCDMIANRMEEGYSNDAKAAISSYGATDPKFIPALLDLREGHVYAPKNTKPVHFVSSTDTRVEMDLSLFSAFGVPTKARRLMSFADWRSADVGRDATGTSGVAQMDEISFGGSATDWKTPVVNGFDVFITLEGIVSLFTLGGEPIDLDPLSGFVMKQSSTAPFKFDCKSAGGCVLLHLVPEVRHAIEFMHTPAYGVPWGTYIEEANAGYVGPAPWGPSKNTYQRCVAENDFALSPFYKDYTAIESAAELPGTSLFSCRMARIIRNFSLAEFPVPKGEFYKVSDCPAEFQAYFS